MQYGIVLEDEIPKIQAAFTESFGNRPKVGIVIIGKCHHKRFYPMKREDTDTGNGHNLMPRNGTVVD